MESSIENGDQDRKTIGLWLAVVLAVHFAILILSLKKRFPAFFTAPLSFRVSSKSFRDACPRRRARWYKCAKRCEKRCAKQTPTEECFFAKCAMNLFIQHLPPPLPLKPKKKPDKISSQQDLHPHKQEGSDETKESSRPVLRKPVKSTVALIDLARMQYWNSVAEQATRKGAKYRDSDGLFPLHWACSGGPPLDVIQALIDAYPSAARKTDREGSTALHFATHYCASFAVVEAVLKVHPEAASTQDRYGRTPLYHAVEKSAGIDVLSLLTSTDPSVITLPCLSHDKRNLPTTRAIARRTPLFLAWSAVVIDKKARETRQGKKWEKAEHLLRVAFSHLTAGVTCTKACNLVMAAVALDFYLPDQVLEYVVKAYPGQLKEADPRTGRLPLQQAAALQPCPRRRAETIIDLLLQAYPAAINARDFAGKSTLQLAVESGKVWPAVVKCLLRACPESIYWLDKTGLSPVLSAASAAVLNDSSPSVEENDMDDENPMGLLTSKERDMLRRRRFEHLKPETDERVATGTEQLSCVYDLLQADPSALSYTQI